MKNYLLDSYFKYLVYAYLCRIIMISNETSRAYQSWVGTENDIYDEIFAEVLTE